jgi:o-succinylbenzoate synthase
MRIATCELLPLADSPCPIGREGWILRLVDERGTIGLGELSPLPGYSLDDAQSSRRALMRVAGRLGEAPVGEPLAMVGMFLAPVERELAGAPSARFALETALFDLVGMRLGCSVAECLGGAAGKRIATSALLGAGGDDGDAWPEQMRALVAAGYRTVKVKLGRSSMTASAERDAVLRLREGFPDVALRLDANGTFAEEEARARLHGLEGARLEFVEEPVHGLSLARLGACDVPWAADESLAIADVAEALLSEDGGKGCAAFVLKPALLGGLLATRRMALRAQARGIDVVVTHMFDGPIAHAAACELALSLTTPPLACGLAPWTAPGQHRPLSHVQAPGWIQPSGAPGLGLGAGELLS